MKHIKTYREASLRSPKLFESSSEEIEQYLNDIFQELKDINFGIKIDNDNFGITITIWKIPYPENGMAVKHLSSFKYGEISEYINSSRDYMKDQGYELIDQSSKYSNFGWNYRLPNSDDTMVQIVVINFQTRY